MYHAAKSAQGFTGAVYFEVNPEIKQFHEARGETVVPISCQLINVGTEEAPDWQLEKAGGDIPFSVTMRQARLALRRGGHLSAVQAAIDSLPEPERTDAEIEWEYAQTVERDSMLVSSLKSALSLTESELDELFTLAASL